MRKLINKIIKNKASATTDYEYIGTWTYDVTTENFRFDRDFTNFLGYDENQKKEYPLAKICSPEYCKSISSILNKSIEENSQLQAEIKLIKSDGKPFFVYLTGFADKHPFVKAKSISGIFIDINRIKHADEEIQKKNEELEALYEESEAQNEELAAMMDELSENQIVIEESNIKLQISEYKYRKIFENAPFGIIQISSEGEIVNINEKFTDIFKLPEDETESITIEKISDSFKNENVTRSILNLRNSDEVVSFSNESALTYDKKIVPVNIKAMSTYDTYSGSELLTIFVEDIEELKTSQFERDLLFNNSSDLLIILDLQGNIKQINPAWTNTLHYTTDEILESGINKLIYSEDIEGMYSFINEIRKSNIPLSHITRFKTRNEDLKIINWTGMGFSDLELVFLSGRDETEKIKTENELKMMWDRFDIASKSGIIGVWDYDLVSHQITLNKSMSDHLGYESNVIKNPEENWFGKIHKEDLKKINIATKRHLKGELDYYMAEYRFILNDGTHRWLLSRGKVTEFDAEHNPLRISGSLTDITDQKQNETKRVKIEQKMQQAQKLESLGILAGGIAHDFNNILQGITGNTDLLIQSMPRDSRFMDELIEIKKSAKRASELTNQMLAYSGRGTFIFKPLDIKDIFIKIDSLIKVSISKKTEINFNIEENLPEFMGDITQLRQVLMNIISNSSDSFMNKPGTIEVSAGICQLTDEKIETMNLDYIISTGDYIYIKISDTGIGIEKKNLDKIFDPFFTTKFAGRGLGLAAVQGIIKSHNGALEVRSKISSGTDFTLYFPVISEDDNIQTKDTAVNKISPEKKIGESTILVVDDEKHIRDLTVKILKLANYKSITATNGLEAIEIFKEMKDDISAIIMDLTMPVLDGDEAMEEIVKIDPDIPIILSSGYSEVDIDSRLRDLKTDIFLHKPYQMEDLINAIERALE